MKTTIKFIICVLTLLALTTSAYAQSPREQLNQMVQQLQKTPSDNTLREQIIKLALTLKPAPALPDTAVMFEGRAQFAFRSAKSENDFLVAAQEYEKAVAAAPWVPGYYADLCSIYEKAGKFEDAKRHCGFYLVGLSDPAEMTNVKRRIAGLNFGIERGEMASKQSAQAAARESQARRFEGNWRQDLVNSSGATSHATMSIKRDAGGAWHIDGIQFYKESNVRDLQLVGSELRFKRDETFSTTDRILTCATYEWRGAVSSDGNMLTFVTTLLPFAPDRSTSNCPPATFYGSSSAWTYYKGFTLQRVP
jgi:hypothetical protein